MGFFWGYIVGAALSQTPAENKNQFKTSSRADLKLGPLVGFALAYALVLYVVLLTW